MKILRKIIWMLLGIVLYKSYLESQSIDVKKTLMYFNKDQKTTELKTQAVLNHFTQENEQKAFLIAGIHFAVIHNNKKLLDFLLQEALQRNFNRAELLNNKNDKDEIPLIRAIKMNYEDMVVYLIKLGAHVNILDGNEETPLMRAIFSENQMLADMLIQAGACTDPLRKRLIIATNKLKRNPKDVQAQHDVNYLKKYFESFLKNIPKQQSKKS